MGAVFGLFAAFYHWISFITGKTYSRLLGILHFWLTFVGVNVTFFPMHLMGTYGMPRRIPDYPDVYAKWNFIASVGSWITVVGLLVFIFLIICLILDLFYFKIYYDFGLFFYNKLGLQKVARRLYRHDNITGLKLYNNLVFLTLISFKKLGVNKMFFVLNSILKYVSTVKNVIVSNFVGTRLLNILLGFLYK